jgi:DNA-binding NtrC family response regulator
VSSETCGRVLVVDDDERIRTMVASYLEEEGYETVAAGDGDTALEYLATSKFDLVLSDVRMPGLDGISLVRMVQDLDPDLPVILVTGESVFDTAVQAVQHGAADYIVKPFSLQELDQAVRRTLERCRQRDERHASSTGDLAAAAAVGAAAIEEAARALASTSSTGDAPEPATGGSRAQALGHAVEAFRGSVNDAVDALLAAISALDGTD